MGDERVDILRVRVYKADGTLALDHEEFPRPQTTLETLAQLKPSFEAMMDFPLDETGVTHGELIRRAYPDLKIEHIHHAGNSSGIVDGAGAVLLGSKAGGEALGVKPRARIKAFANIGSDPALMLTGPVDVTEKLLKRAGMTIGDIDLFELNEAYAAVVLRYMQAFDIDHDKINVNGGAIAMGHPLGATGAMIFGTVLDELERQGKQTALVTLCIGAGMGTATIIERV